MSDPVAPDSTEPTRSTSGRDVRIIITSLGALVAAGLAGVLAAQYLGIVCHATICGMEGLLWFPLIPMWALIIGVAAGRLAWAWERHDGRLSPDALATALVGAMALAWLAIQLVFPVQAWSLYGAPLDAFVGLADIAFLFYWTLATAIGVACVWTAPRLVRRWLP